jgi:mannitol-specific phosphotransferase system IIBC component
VALVIIGLLIAFAIGFSVCALLSDNKRAQLEDRLRAADKLCEAVKELKTWSGFEKVRKAIAEHEGKED